MKGAANTLATLRPTRTARPDRAPIDVILDNLSAHKGDTIRRWATKHRDEPCFTPAYASWANPIKAHFGPLRRSTVANSHHRNHTGLGPCTVTCAGAMSTPATGTPWQQSAANRPGSAVRRASAGEDQRA